MARSVWDENTAKKYVGDYLGSYFGYSLNNEIRENAASGGMVSTILINELQEKHIDGALVCHTAIKDSKVSAEYLVAVD